MSHEQDIDLVSLATDIVADTLEAVGDTSFDAQQPVYLPGVFDQVRDRTRGPQSQLTFISRMIERGDEGTYETMSYTRGQYHLDITTLHEPVRGVVDLVRRIGRRPESKFVLVKRDTQGEVLAKIELKVYGRNDGCVISYSDRTREHDFSHVSINEHGMVGMSLDQMDHMRSMLDDIDVII